MVTDTNVDTSSTEIKRRPIEEPQPGLVNKLNFIRTRGALKKLGVGLAVVGLVIAGCFVVFAVYLDTIAQTKLSAPFAFLLSRNRLQEPVFINSYPIPTFEEIDNSIPRYPNSTAIVKLQGKNNQNQAITRVYFSIPERVARENVVQFFQRKLPENGWIIKESQEKHIISAEKQNQLLEFIPGESTNSQSDTRYTIELLEGGLAQAVLQLPSDFPPGLIPPETEILDFLVGLDSTKDSFMIFEFEVKELPSANEHIGMMEAAGWDEDCTVVSIAWEQIYGCSKGDSKITVGIHYSLDGSRPETSVHLSMPLDIRG